jgi:hypothetical protein
LPGGSNQGATPFTGNSFRPEGELTQIAPVYWAVRRQGTSLHMLWSMLNRQWSAQLVKGVEGQELYGARCGVIYQENPTFRHRRNQDSGIDSICSECLLTVASGRIELELSSYEEAHVCDPLRLRHLRVDRLVA